jgi:hypothetical protein
MQIGNVAQSISSIASGMTTINSQLDDQSLK